jgi:hypothetical protein
VLRTIFKTASGKESALRPIPPLRTGLDTLRVIRLKPLPSPASAEPTDSTVSTQLPQDESQTV